MMSQQQSLVKPNCIPCKAFQESETACRQVALATTELLLCSGCVTNTAVAAAAVAGGQL
jgi:hypothetical protein